MAVKSQDFYTKKMQQRRSDRMDIEKAFELEAGLKDIITVQPAAELATMEYYKNIPGVAIEPDVKQFWEAQQTKFNSIQNNIKSIQSSYMRGYEIMMDAQDSLEKQIERTSGIYDPNRRIKELENQKHKIKVNEINQITNRANPGMVLLEKFTGFGNEETRKITEPFEHLKQINKQIKEAKRRKEEMMSAKNELKAKVEDGKLQMLEAISLVDRQKCDASLANDNSKKIKEKLQEQYKIVDMYQSVQTFKTSKDYGSIKTALKSSNPELVQDLDNLPKTIPDGLLKISLTNPLDLSKLPVSSKKLQEVDEKINNIKGKLPAGINIDNISGEIEMYSLKQEELDVPGEAYCKYEKELQEIDSMGYSPEEKAKKEQQLKMKMDRLKRVAVINNAKLDIKNTIEEINSMSPTDPNLKHKYDELEAKKGRLNLLQEELKTDKYSQTLEGLNEIQKLLDEKAKLKEPASVAKIETISNGLDQAQIQTDKRQTISEIYGLIKQSFYNKRLSIETQYKQQEIDKKDRTALPYGKFQKPNTPEQNPDRNDDEGR